MNPTASTSIRATWPIMASQAQVIFNDNAAKLILVGLIQVIMPKEQIPAWVAALTALVILPYLGLSPLCGWIADRYSKRSVLLVSVWAQLFIMAFLIACCLIREPYLASFTFFLLAAQSALMAPAKQGILKEIVGSEGLGRAVGWMEMLTMASILVGSYFGGWIFDEATRFAQGSAWNGALWGCVLLSVGCLLSFAIIYQTPKVPAQAPGETFSRSLFYGHFRDIAFVARHRHLWLASLGVAYFYALGFFLYLIILQVGRETFAGSSEAARLSGWLYAVMGMGIAVGSLLAAYVSRHRPELGIIPVGGCGFPLALILLYFVGGSGLWFQAGLFLLGICGGLFVVPLYAFLQDGSDDNKRGRVLAATNVLINLGGVGALLLQGILAGAFHLSAPAQLLLCAVFAAACSFVILWFLPDALVRFLIIFNSQFFYRFTARGRENIPRQGGVLLVCNHVSYIDTVPLQWACPRTIRFMAWDGFFKGPLFGAALRVMKAVPVSRTRAKDSIRAAVEMLQRGEVVCIFPEGQLTRTGKLMGFRRGFELIARKAGVPVLPAHLDSLWWSIFAFSGGRYFFKLPRQLPLPVTVSFGKPLSNSEADSVLVREKVQELCAEAFARRRELNQHTGKAVVHALRQSRNQARFRVFEGREDSRHYAGEEILSLARALAGAIRSAPGEQALLLSGKPFTTFLAQLAAALADRPLLVASPEVMDREMIEARGIRTILADQPRDGLFSADGTWLDLNAWTLPDPEKRGSSRGMDPAKSGGDRLFLEFVSARHPGGLKFTHRQWIANLLQIGSTHAFWPDDRFLSGMGADSPFGSIISFWVPLVTGAEMVFPAHLDEASLAGAAEKSWPSVLCVDESSFPRNPAAFQTHSPRFLLTGPEPIGDAFRQRCEERGLCPLPAWGTEAIPVASLNLPDPNDAVESLDPQQGNCPGSMGRVLPGIAARIVDPNTGQPQSPLVEGELLLSSASQTGTLDGDDPLPWLNTNRNAFFDEEGFLFLKT